jgi:glucose dehydrogenase
MGVSSAQSLAFIVFVATVTQRISLVAPDSSNHDKENVMTRLTRMFSLVLATSMLVLSAYSEAATIRYDVTNAETVQEGYSLSGYFDVSGTGNVTSFSSFSLTATKAENPTLTFDSGSSNLFVDGVMIATESALYLPSGSVLYIDDIGRSISWYNNSNGYSAYGANSNDGENIAWSSQSYPNTDENGWRVGSVQAAVPEIDPNSVGSVLALVLGSLGLLERRRLKVA